MVITIGNFEGIWSLELTKGLVRNVLKNMDWVKSKRTTGKVEPCANFLEEEKFSFQRAISKFVSEHDKPHSPVFHRVNAHLI